LVAKETDGAESELQSTQSQNVGFQRSDFVKEWRVQSRPLIAITNYVQLTHLEALLSITNYF